MLTFRQMHNEIFDVREISIMANPVIMMTVRGQVEVKHNDKTQYGTPDWQGIVHTVENSSCDHIINICSGMPAQTGDEEYDEANSKRLAQYPLSIDEIVEVYDLTEEIRFCDPQEMVDTYHKLYNYKVALVENTKFNVHAKDTPEEDITKMNELLSVLAAPVERIEDSQGLFANTQLESFFAGFLGVVVADDKSLVISKANKTQPENRPMFR